MLAFEEYLIETHDDFCPYADLCVGFDDDGSLTFLLRVKDYQEPEQSYERRLYIKRNDAFALAQKLNVPLTALPKFFRREWGADHHSLHTANECVGMFRELKDYFKPMVGIRAHQK